MEDELLGWLFGKNRDTEKGITVENELENKIRDIQNNFNLFNHSAELERSIQNENDRKFYDMVIVNSNLWSSWLESTTYNVFTRYPLDGLQVGATLVMLLTFKFSFDNESQRQIDRIIEQIKQEREIMNNTDNATRSILSLFIELQKNSGFILSYGFIEECSNYAMKIIHQKMGI